MSRKITQVRINHNPYINETILWIDDIELNMINLLEESHTYNFEEWVRELVDYLIKLNAYKLSILFCGITKDWIIIKNEFSKPEVNKILNKPTIKFKQGVYYKDFIAKVAAEFSDLRRFLIIDDPDNEILQLEYKKIRKPSDIYDGLSLRTLRALNCAEGAVLLSASSNRCFVKELQKYYPDIFRGRLNDAQCKYLKRLIDNDLTVGETGRLFLARSADLARMWVHTQYETFISIEKQRVEEESIIEEFAEVDPFYSIYLKKYMRDDADYWKLSRLRICLFVERDEYDKAFRRSNREREYDWQERNDDYIVRYPQTINDFCREVVYQRNCLMGFLDSVLQNDTTILFMRKAEDQNMPFITIEIFENRLTQAYHRLNRDCTREEAEWIREYCRRHGIDEGKFKFNVLEDDLM